MIPYADLATLLLALFVVLFVAVKSENDGRAASTLGPSGASTAFVQLEGEPEPRLEAESASGSAASPSETSAATFETSNGAAVPPSRRESDSALWDLRNRVTQFASTQVDNRLLTRSEERGFIVSLVEAGFFDTGEAEPRPEALPIIDTLGRMLADSTNHIRIEGHTDDRPIRTNRFPSNWELSTARATWLVAYLVQEFGIEPDRLSAAGYGEFRPIASNETLEGRSRNRRVDIVLLSSEFVDAEEPIVSTSRGLSR
jgi:chemotaxis protein MotB